MTFRRHYPPPARARQTNFVRMLWKFGSIYSTERLLADHERPVRYAMAAAAGAGRGRPSPAQLYVHHPTSVATALGRQKRDPAAVGCAAGQRRSR
jgi:hypothetical protein